MADIIRISDKDFCLFEEYPKLSCNCKNQVFCNLQIHSDPVPAIGGQEFHMIARCFCEGCGQIVELSFMQLKSAIIDAY